MSPIGDRMAADPTVRYAPLLSRFLVLALCVPLFAAIAGTPPALAQHELTSSYQHDTDVLVGETATLTVTIDGGGLSADAYVVFRVDWSDGSSYHNVQVTAGQSTVVNLEH